MGRAGLCAELSNQALSARLSSKLEGRESAGSLAALVLGFKSLSLPPDNPSGGTSQSPRDDLVLDILWRGFLL